MHHRLFGIMGAAAMWALPLVSAGATLPVKDWVQFPRFRSVFISPSGKYLAVVSSPKNSDTYQLVILKTHRVLEGHPKVSAHLNLREYEQFASIAWVNNNRLIASTARQLGGFDRPFLDGNLYAVGARGGQIKHLMGQYGGGNLGSRTSGTNEMVFFDALLSRLPQEQNIVLVEGSTPGSDLAGAYVLDTVSGNFHRVVTGLWGGGMLADHRGTVRLMWGFNQRTGRPEITYRANASAAWKNVSDIVGANEKGGPIMFGPHNQKIYYFKETVTPKETLGLFTFNVKTWKTKLLYKNKTVDVGIGAFPDTTPFIRSFNDKSLVGLRIMPGRIETLALDANAPRMQLLAGLQHTFAGKEVEITSHTRDGTEAIVKVWGDLTPASFYLYSSRPKPSVTLLFHATPWIKSDDLSPMHPITYRARDGMLIHGYLTVPRGVKAKNLPLVIYVHGGPHGIRYDWGFDAIDFDQVATEILANHGYAVLAPNYRGSGGYGFSFEYAGFRHWGSTMQNDLADAVNWAVSKGIANPRRICILGASYGGYAALMSAERFPDLFQCAVGYSGVYDLPMLETRKSIFDRDPTGRLSLRKFLGTNKKQLRAFSPAFHASRLKAAVLLLHGGRDDKAPPAGYEEMVSAIKKYGTPLQTLYYRNEGHGFYKPAHRRKAWNDILSFLYKHIGPGVTEVSGANH